MTLLLIHAGVLREIMGEGFRVKRCMEQSMAQTERARSLGDGPAVTRRSLVTDVVPDDPVKRLTLLSRDVRLHGVKG